MITAGLLTFLNKPGKEERYKVLSFSVLRFGLLVAFGKLEKIMPGKDPQVASVERPAWSPDIIEASYSDPFTSWVRVRSDCLQAGGDSAVLKEPDRAPGLTSDPQIGEVISSYR